MAEIRLPLSITYETTEATPVPDVIRALQATDVAMKEAVSLLPSLIRGLQIDGSSLNVRMLSQESPLRELFFVSVLFTFQDDLEREVPPMIEDLFSVTVSDKYDTLVTVAFLVVVFYGAGIAIDAVKKTFAESLPRAKLDELVEVLALETGRSPDALRKIIAARYGRPGPAKRIASAAKRLFAPSRRDRNAAVVFDRDRIPSEVVREIPFPGEADSKVDFDRYEPHENVFLDIHAQDKDKTTSGWAAVAPQLAENRLRLRVMEPLRPSDLWGLNAVKANVVLVSKLTANGYQPSEIQVLEILGAAPSGSNGSSGGGSV